MHKGLFTRYSGTHKCIAVDTDNMLLKELFHFKKCNTYFLIYEYILRKYIIVWPFTFTDLSHFKETKEIKNVTQFSGR